MRVSVRVRVRVRVGMRVRIRVRVRVSVQSTKPPSCCAVRQISCVSGRGIGRG